MRASYQRRFFFRYLPALLLLFTTSGGSALAVTPGVDIAVPKVTVVIIASDLAFVPPLSVVEQGDYVLWNNTGSGSHTTTSGSPCVANNIWNAPLGPGVQFMRQFIEPAGTLAYFCVPHCGLGMTGNVRVTTPIAVQAVDNAGTLTLSWAGGGPTYQVFRSSAPAFMGSTPLQPAGGDTGTSFSDPSAVNLGSVNFYLIMNK
jgi:plastocyanin